VRTGRRSPAPERYLVEVAGRRILVPGIVNVLWLAPPDGVVGVVEPGVVGGGDVVVGTVGTVAAGVDVVGTVVAGVLAAGGAAAAGAVTVAGAGVDSGVSSSVTSATAMPAASNASSTPVTATGQRQLGGGWTRVRAASPHSRHQP
jgi:hypothetical protein